MKRNMCAADRIVRLVLVAIAIVLLVTKVATGVLAIVVGVIAALLLITSATGICWLYVPFGVSTRRKEPARPDDKKDGSSQG